MAVLTRIVGVALSPAIAGVGDEEVTEEDGGGVEVLVLEGGGCLDVVVVLLRDGQHSGVQLDTGNIVNTCISRPLYQRKKSANYVPQRTHLRVGYLTLNRRKLCVERITPYQILFEQKYIWPLTYSLSLVYA